METFVFESFLFLRVGLAVILGAIIGFERKVKYKEAGIRTHALVCGGSALFMVISKYSLADSNIVDNGRIAAQIVSGIGFIGAGIIVYKKNVLRGLTTAAGVWMTAGIGMASGAGMYYLAGMATAIQLLIHVILSLPIRIFKTKRFFGFKVEFLCENDDIDQVKKLFNINRFSCIDYKKNGENTHAVAELHIQNFITDDELFKILTENKFIHSIRRIVE